MTRTDRHEDGLFLPPPGSDPVEPHRPGVDDSDEARHRRRNPFTSPPDSDSADQSAEPRSGAR